MSCAWMADRECPSRQNCPYDGIDEGGVMRVVAGKAKGKLLLAPPGKDTRPITAMMKEALFSMWHFSLPGSAFLDLFAGSGSMGIEAISRGAKKAVFVENHRIAVDVIQKNIVNCKFDREAEVYQDDVFRRIPLLSRQGERFDIIYLDPPFTVSSIFIPVMETLAKENILNPDGVIAIRSEKNFDMPDAFGDLVKYKEKKYGISVIHFYRLGDAR